MTGKTRLDREVSEDVANHRQDLISRRKWLGALGATALAAPILPLFNRFARAQEIVRPRNLVIIYHQNGFEVSPPWWAHTTNAMGQTVWTDAVGRLDAFNDPALLGRVTAIRGIQNGITNEVLAHSQGTASMWTGFLNATAAGNVYSPYNSIDQIIADRISAGLAFNSLQFGVRSQQNFGVPPTSNENNQVFRNGQPIPHQDDPNAMYMRIFGGAASSPQELMAARARKRSVLDFLGSDLNRIRNAYSAEEQAKIEAHLAQIREIERRLDIPLADTCDPSEFMSNVAPTASGPMGYHTHGATDAVMALQQQLLRMSLRCGMTRVASVMMFSSLSNVNTPSNPVMGVHGTMHAGAASDRHGINRYFAEAVARLATDMAAEIDPVTQRSLLDDTVIAWSTDMAVGNHLPHPVPFFFIGGDPEHGFFAPGLIDVPENAEKNRGVERIQHTRVLLSILQAFGVREVGQNTLGDFSDPSLAVGPFWGVHRHNQWMSEE